MFLSWKDFLFDFGELITIFMLLNFLKLIVWSSFLELVWPTHFFNKKNNIFFNSLRFRTFVEFISKFRIINNYYNLFSSFFLKYFFLKKRSSKKNLKNKRNKK